MWYDNMHKTLHGKQNDLRKKTLNFFVLQLRHTIR